MFAYEMQQVRQAELRRSADEWRLAQQARAARVERRAPARRTTAGSAVRTDQEAAESTGRGRRHTLRPHSAA
ncbi:hypothetical protein [Streptomyces sp. NBC_01477]|uniref:hypothetical protein n=1 Tax=Streptomyces sp. NBC_01477 TaxID=2976015 RepID=UPI002E36AC3F|nr:hypothetical protein [Streptomyces sp. NBC_01477]